MDEMMNGSLDELGECHWTHIDMRLMDDHQIDLWIDRCWLDKQKMK